MYIGRGNVRIRHPMPDNDVSSINDEMKIVNGMLLRGGVSLQNNTKTNTNI